MAPTYAPIATHIVRDLTLLPFRVFVVHRTSCRLPRSACPCVSWATAHRTELTYQILQCATSLASTFDADLVHEAGQFLAEEAKIKSSVILLAPTCNIQRNPAGGRAFESFSEDPHLSGTSLEFGVGR